MKKFTIIVTNIEGTQTTKSFLKVSIAKSWLIKIAEDKNLPLIDTVSCDTDGVLSECGFSQDDVVSITPQEIEATTTETTTHTTTEIIKEIIPATLEEWQEIEDRKCRDEESLHTPQVSPVQTKVLHFPCVACDGTGSIQIKRPSGTTTASCFRCASPYKVPEEKGKITAKDSYRNRIYDRTANVKRPQNGLHFTLFVKKVDGVNTFPVGFSRMTEIFTPQGVKKSPELKLGDRVYLPTKDDMFELCEVLTIEEKT